MASGDLVALSNIINKITGRRGRRGGVGGGGEAKANNLVADRRVSDGPAVGFDRRLMPSEFDGSPLDSMWSSFWRPRNRFSVEELRYLTDQLHKVQIVNEDNKDFVVETLRSIAELVTYGDQHDPAFFEFFMEKQVMSEFVRILRISRTTKVALQLLQTMSIMIQNLRSEHAIHYIFSNEHINYLITYSFNFRNEELLSYYISFLRAISGKLDKSTIPLLVKIQNEEVISFPLYFEAIRFAFHEENMVRIAVRALTLNVYHVGDEYVNKYVSHQPQSEYFSNMVKYCHKQCMNLDEMVSQATRNPGTSDSDSCILVAVDEIEDNLYYFSDIISSGVPDIGRLITDNLLQLLIFPLLLPSLRKQNVTTTDAQIGIRTALFLLCCILHVFKAKDLASIIASTLFFPPEGFKTRYGAMLNGHGPELSIPEEPIQHESFSVDEQKDREKQDLQNLSSLPQLSHDSQKDICCFHTTLREILLSYLSVGGDLQVLGSLCLLSTLLQTKELDESMLDGLGILPQRKQHKKLLLQALVGEDTDEEKLFSSNETVKDNTRTELDRYLRDLKNFGMVSKLQINHVITFGMVTEEVACSPKQLHPPISSLEEQFRLPFCVEQEISPQSNRYQVLEALVVLFCRSDVSAEILWVGGWLFRQLLPHGEDEFTVLHLKQFKDKHKTNTSNVLGEIKGTWCDILITVLKDEWRKCKRAIEASSPPKVLKSIILSPKASSSEDESSFSAGERMCEMIKVFVLQCQLLIFSSGGMLPDLHPLSSINSPAYSCSKTSPLDVLVPKPGAEVSLANAIPCRIAFEKGKERHFSFLTMSSGTSGWVLLAEELRYTQENGVVQVAAPLAGSDPRIDERHPKWLHLRIRPSTLPFLDPSRFENLDKGKVKALVDGRWTLAFKDDQACKAAKSMVIDELNRLHSEVEKELRLLLKLDIPGFASQPGTPVVELRTKTEVD